MDTLNKIALQIIREQAIIIGPLAWSEARKVNGLKIINSASGEVSVESEKPKEVVDSLVEQYERLFGRASHEVCREAVASIIRDLAPADVPASLAA